MNKEIEKILKRVDLEKRCDTCGFEFADGYSCSFDNIAICYDDRLILSDYVKHLQSKLDKINEYCEKHKFEYKDTQFSRYVDCEEFDNTSKPSDIQKIIKGEENE